MEHLTDFPNLKNHNYSIDILRFIAALMVTLFHLNQAIIPVHNWYRNTINYGWLGVPVFFVISGYCIIASAYTTNGIKDFLTKRFYRIFPPFWISIIIVYGSAVFQKLYTGTNSVHNLPNTFVSILANLTLCTAPLSKIETINWVYWSLTCEVMFYLVISLGLLLNKKFLVYFLIAISILSAASLKQHYGLLFFLNNWPAFGLGLSLYYFFKFNTKSSILNFVLLFTINAFALHQKFNAKPEYLIATSITFLLIAISKYYPTKQSFASILGQHSYSVYLIHVPVGVFIFGLFETEYIKITPGLNLLYDLSVFAIINVIASIMFNKIEKPSIQFGKELIKKLKSNLKSTEIN